MEDLTLVDKTREGLAKEMLKIGRENKELKEKLEFVKGLFIHWGGLRQSDACFALDTNIDYETHSKEYEKLCEIMGLGEKKSPTRVHSFAVMETPEQDIGLLRAEDERTK